MPTKYIILLVLLIAGCFYFSGKYNLEIITWKDTDNLERIVIYPRASKEKSGVPFSPEDTNRFTQRHGIIPALQYAGKTAASYIPNSKKEEEEDGCQAQSRFPASHTLTVVSSPEARVLHVSSSAKKIESVPSENTVQEEPEKQLSDMVSRTPEAAAPVLHSPRQYEDSEHIILGTFNLHQWNASMLNDPTISEPLLDVLAQYDLIALQGVYISNEGILKKLAANLSTYAGRRYEFAAATAAGIKTSQETLFFLYDTSTIMADPLSIFRIKADPSGILCPLAVTFTTRKVPAQEALTFTAVNLSLSAGRETDQMYLLSAIMKTAQEQTRTPEGSSEDDIILMGHFGASPTIISQYLNSESFTCVADGVSTSVSDSTQDAAENILFRHDATVEYAAAGGIWDLNEHFKSGVPDSLPWQPVWVKLTAREGGNK